MKRVRCPKCDHFIQFDETKYAEGHHELTEVLLSREVIFTEDVERIFGKRQWASRTDELLAAKPEEEPKETEQGE